MTTLPMHYRGPDPARSPPLRPGSALTFLEVAKRCEIAEFEQLELTCELVDITGGLIHGLQRERGLTNLYLGSARVRQGPERDAQIAECRHLEEALLSWFDRLDRSPRGQRSSARLYYRIAYVLQGLEALPGLREQVVTGCWTTTRATAAYARLITALLSLVFEAADSATDPEVSRLLVAMFNLSQGKEFAGLERAVGSAMFATGRARAHDQGRMAHLIESQERCLAICAEFATPGGLALLRLNEAPAAIVELERLRRVLLGAEADAPLARERGAQWFDCCTRRVDEMRRAEVRFCDQLRQLCRDKGAAARSELAAYATLIAAAAGARGGDDARSAADVAVAAGDVAERGGVSIGAGGLGAVGHAAEGVAVADPGVAGSGGEHGLDAAPGSCGSAPPSTAVPFFDDPEITDEPPAALEPATRTLGPLLERSVLDLVREQSQRLQSTRAELDAVRATLNERKVIERAKGLLMAHRQLSEDQAHKAMRQMAMNQNRRLVDVAEAVLTMADILSVATPPSATRSR
jgi:hypothetical protein